MSDLINWLKRQKTSPHSSTAGPSAHHQLQAQAISLKTAPQSLKAAIGEALVNVFAYTDNYGLDVKQNLREKIEMNAQDHT
jgi:NTP pyrophosphatase (non-canonical NTP hydrolase)